MYLNNQTSFGENHLRIIWRASLALGVIPALAVLLWRLSMDEPQRYKKDSMKNAKIPYLLILKRYGVSLAAISITWFIYDFITYVSLNILFLSMLILKIPRYPVRIEIYHVSFLTILVRNLLFHHRR